ncbi:hypothetical protein I0Q91_12010 [Halanaerobiaceae bacterium Z-7014]|uniref:Uncharacterized protein n=1 Tax=Halonatronomonas betaini TaxID=2778430 RepID=A0A931ARU8_9FIRM|nr:hypothetical protein [Halonatronomonas betaini]MBF8437812.1 hypothetical protein [Halonatronomonas betaini]
MGDRIKSSYEIAMERAEKIDVDADTEKLDLRSEIRPILSKFFQDKIDADGLWEEFKDSEAERLAEAQRMIVSSLGLNSNQQEIKLRKEGLMAIEDLKEDPNPSELDQLMAKVSQTVQQYNQEQEQLQRKLESMLRQAAGANGQQPQDVMELLGNLDENTQRQLQQARQEIEERFKEEWESLEERLNKFVSQE